MSAWTAGTRVGPYELTSPIGAGGMGEVWKARDTRLNRTVAIKRLKTGHAERFKREAQAIAALNHPHICQLYDVGDDYLVMEFVDGAPLARRLPAEDVVKLAIQIAAALEEAHARGIVHRDLKPANILVTAKGAKLLDFGLAKVEAAAVSGDSTISVNLTEPGVVMGTAAYMSPEQARGFPVDARSDIFSFGAVLYEALSGRRPFRGESTLDTLSAIVKEEPPALDTLPALERIVRRCLAKAAADRYQTMVELRSALEQAVTRLPDQQPSIAVLPFANMSRGEEDEYFSDGLAEEIINALVKVPGLKVIARTSAFAFKGRNEDIRKIAETLGVTNVLEGSVRRAGSRIRVTAQLIAAADGTHLWSERYDREMADVFAIQDEISQAIADALQLKLSPGSLANQRHQPPLAAYEALLKGRYYMQKFTPESLARGETCFREALEIDPQLAVAHCELGLIYFYAATENRISAADAASRMEMEGQRALALDPSLLYAHAVLALVSVLAHNWKRAGDHFERALASGHFSSTLRGSYALFYLAPMGRWAQASEQIAAGLREDPLNVWLAAMTGMFLIAKGDPAGEAELSKALELNEDYWIPLTWLANYYTTAGRVEEAVAIAERAYEQVPEQWGVLGGLAGALSLAGDTARAEALMQRAGTGETYGAPVAWFTFHALRQDFQAAAAWLEKAIEQGDTRAPWIVPYFVGPGFTASPYWPPLAKKMNLAEAS